MYVVRAPTLARTEGEVYTINNEGRESFPKSAVPPSAHRALNAAPEVGVLLPCNVTVSVEDGKTVVRAMNPAIALALIDSAVLADVAREVGAALQRVVDHAAAA